MSVCHARLGECPTSNYPQNFLIGMWASLRLKMRLKEQVSLDVLHDRSPLSLKETELFVGLGLRPIYYGQKKIGRAFYGVTKHTSMIAQQENT